MDVRSISCTDSKRRSSSNESDGVQILYLKDNVTTQYESERMSGRLLLIKHQSSIFMTWIPYITSPSGTGSVSNCPKLFFDRNLYTITTVPLADVHSIRSHTPTLGWQYIIVVLSSGREFTPLYFYNGGVCEFLATLKEHVFLVRCADDDAIVSSSLELPSAVSVANSPTTSSDPAPSGETVAKFEDGSYIITQYDREKHEPACDISILVLEQFLLVTKFAPEEVHVASDPLEWAALLDAEGRVVDSNSLRKRIFYGGVDHSLRKEVWKLLLGYHECGSTYAEREYLAAVKKSEYETMKGQCEVRMDSIVSFYDEDTDENPHATMERDILLTYLFYNCDLGYCKGMSDLLSPILFVMKDEAESFWCFVELMKLFGPKVSHKDAHGTTLIGLILNDAIILGADGLLSDPVTHLTLERDSEKIFKIGSRLYFAIANNRRNGEKVVKYLQTEIARVSKKPQDRPPIPAIVKMLELHMEKENIEDVTSIIAGWDKMPGGGLRPVMFYVKKGLTELLDSAVVCTMSTEVTDMINTTLQEGMNKEQVASVVFEALNFSSMNDPSTGGKFRVFTIEKDAVTRTVQGS